MKPTSIRRFDSLYLANIVLSLVGSFLSYGAMVSEIEMRTAAAGLQLGSGTVIATIALGTAISLLLWFLVSRKALGFAKWIIVILFLVALASAFGLFGTPSLISGAWTSVKAISAVMLLLQAAAVFYLFQPDAKAWFAKRTATAVDGSNPSVD